ncbi:MAG: LLM class flavin-dependent oxidoreductase [Acidimicrobiales bacterium]
MDVGMQLVFASWGWPDHSDAQVMDEELRLALQAEELGFDCLWPVEHHFFDYSFCPDNTQLLSYLAGVTERIDLGTAAVIMPWNEPLRVAEKISLLDNISGGRVRFGMGRGLSRREYDRMRGIEMSESRGRFDEGATMVLDALRTGYIEGDGPFYPQMRAQIRPAPARDFSERIYAVASSDDSVESAARLRARMVMFADRSWNARLPGIERWRELYREFHNEEPPPPMTADFVYCHEDPDVAKERAVEYQGNYLASVLHHYEVMGDHFAGIDGYEAYAKASQVLNKIGESGFLQGFMDACAHGTPEQIIENFRARRELIGPFELATCFRYGGIPIDQAEASMQLFAAEVLPVIKRWD